MLLNKKGLIFDNLNDKQGLILDPDNIFWGISSENQNDKILFSRKMISLYEKLKNTLDKEMFDFRFSANLSAIYIDPTDRCNADCPYCYIPRKIRKNGRSMTESELMYILEKITKYFSARGGSAFGGKNKKRKPVIVFHASEPLLVKDIIFGAIKKYSRVFKFGLQTNATLLEKVDVEFLKRYRVGVGISFDSNSPSINDRLRIGVRGKGNFTKAVKAIEWFNGYEGLNIITTVTKFNVKGLSILIKFLHTKKVPCVLLNPIRLTQKNSRSLKPNEKTLIKYFIKAVDTAIGLSKNTKQKIIVGNFANVILAIVSPAARRLMCDISPCGGGRCFFTITAKGEMIPCGEFIGINGFSGGNIFRTSIEKAMQSLAFKKIRARYVEKIDKCRGCVFRNICGAPCPAELHALGNMFKKSIFCNFYKEIISYAFRIIAEKKEKYCLREAGFKNLRYEYRLGGQNESHKPVERR